MGKRQKELPGMENRRLKDLQDAAVNYADVRDRRIGLSMDEGSLKVEILALMKKHGKTHYECEGVIIDLITEKENVKVKVNGKEAEE